MFKRLCNPLISNSFLLLGARGTGKSHLVSRLLADKSTLTVDLLVPELERRLRRRPSLLSSMIAERKDLEWVYIDEVQKVPALLDLVHQHIERDKMKFALTGSSARKLRRGSANLLAGRAFSYQLFPLSFYELGAAFVLDDVLAWGSLPKVINSASEQEKRIFLESYAHTYIKEEVLAEQLVRNIAPFESFLEVAAQMNGEIINFSKISRQIDSQHTSVRTYFDILVDTMMGFYLPGFASSARKRLALSPKFYFFDAGVQRALEFSLDSRLAASTFAYGKAFESLVVQEVYRLNSYFRKNYELSYIRTQAGVEIDLVLRKGSRELILIEVKSTASVRDDHLSALRSLGTDLKPTRSYCLSMDPVARLDGEIKVVPWQQGIMEIFE